MILTDKKYKRFSLLAFSGLLTGIILAFPVLGILEWISLVPCAVFFLCYATDRSVKLRHIYLYGFFMLFLFYIVNYHWFIKLYPLSFMGDISKFGAAALLLFVIIGLSALQAALGGLSMLLMAIVLRTRPMEKFKFLRPISAACVWVVFEWSFTLVWWCVPWGRLPIGQSGMLVGLQTASLFGSYFITFIIVAVNFYIAYALVTFITDKPNSSRAIKRSATVIAAMFVFNYGAGAVLWYTNKTDTENTKKIRIASVQGNIPSGDVWTAETDMRTEEAFEKYTLLAAEQGADIVVWPESAFPYTLREENFLYDFISDVAQRANVTILAGVFTEDEGGDHKYNTTVVFTPDGKMSDMMYNKRHIVPFGEYIPMRWLVDNLMPDLSNMLTTGSDLTVGEGMIVFDLEEGKIGNLICFDSIYENIMLEGTRDGAEMFVLPTNDSWFTDSAAIYMHTAQAQIRAIECGRYISRTANTGLTAVITNRGEITAELPLLEEGMLCEDIYLRSDRTLYSYIGNLFVYLCIAFLTVEIAWNIAYTCKKRDKKK